MNREEFTNEMFRNIDKLLDKDILAKILNKNNNLIRLDILNRIALAIMNDSELYDVKTSDEWEFLGRKVIDFDKKLYLAVPKYTTRYIDTKTKDKANINELTQEEIGLAIKYGVIAKEEFLDYMMILPTYDIRNTSSLNKNTEYNLNKPDTSLAVLYNIAEDLCKITVEQSEDESYFSNKDNHLYLAKDSYDNMVETIVDIIVNYLINNKLDSEACNKQLRLVRSFTKYSIMSIFGCASKEELFAELRDCDIKDANEILELVTISDELTFDVVCRLQYRDGSYIKDGVSSIVRLKKAESFYNILQASYVYNNLMK